MKRLIKRILKEDDGFKDSTSNDWSWSEGVDIWEDTKKEALYKLRATLRGGREDYYPYMENGVIFVIDNSTYATMEGEDEVSGGYTMRVDEENTRSLEEIKYEYGVFIQYDGEPPSIDWEEENLTLDKVVSWMEM